MLMKVITRIRYTDIGALCNDELEVHTAHLVRVSNLEAIFHAGHCNVRIIGSRFQGLRNITV
jgi:hypothetical protein